MAKKEKDGIGELFLGLLAIIAFLIYFASLYLCLLTPVILIILPYYFKSKALKSYSSVKEIETNKMYELTQEEKEKYKLLLEQLELVQQNLEQIRRKVIENNISINKDGSISQRSKLGKQLHMEWEKNQGIKGEILNAINDLKTQDEYRKVNYQNLLNKTHKSFRLQYAFKGSIFIWIIAVFGFLLYLYHGHIILGIKDYFNALVNIISFKDLTSIERKIVYYPTLLVYIIIFLKYLASSNNDYLKTIQNKSDT